MNCAVCGTVVEDDRQHVWVDPTMFNTDEDLDGFYAFHTVCWENVTGGWQNI